MPERNGAREKPEPGRRPGGRPGRRRTLFRVLTALPLLGLVCLVCWILTPCPAPLDGVPFSRCLRDREGGLLRLGLAADGAYRLRTRLEDLPPEAVRTVIRYEDRHFWSHPGVNPLSLARAAWGMITGGRRMGGSTLTMQVARLRLGLRTGSLPDKLRQMAWALRLERHWSKEEILEAYFSLAPYGGNVEGLRAAALVYFHKSPARLTESELLALLPVPQNPALRAPSERNPRFLAAAARLRELAEEKTREEGPMPLLRAGSAPLRVHGPKELPFKAPHLCAELLARDDLPEETRTTLDPSLQRLLEEQIRLYVARTAREGVANAAALLADWRSGEILALAGSADFFSERIQGQLDMTAQRRSPGSTLKTCLYALALEEGRIHPRTLLTDLPRSFAGWEPENFDGGYQGPLPADEALRLSRNVPAITLANALSPPGLYGFLTRAGVRFTRSAEHYGLGLVLGGAEVTARELAGLYAMLADGGLGKQLVYVQGDAPGAPVRLLSRASAWLALEMLRSDAPAARVRSGGREIPLRTKTGTSSGLRDAWTCGILGPYVLVVWLGNADNSPNPLLVGARTALPLFTDICRALAAERPLTDLLAEPPEGSGLERLSVCTDTGDTDLSLCPEKARQTGTWFIPGVSPVRPTGILRRVAVQPRTGLRTCLPDEESEMRVAEFWPSEMRQLYARAGIVKPLPPPLAPDCPRTEPVSGPPPRIVQPRAGLVYHARGKERACPLVLQAQADAGVQTIWWFSGTDFLGNSAPGESLLYAAPPGDHVIRALDDAGRSASRRVSVRRLP